MYDRLCKCRNWCSQSIEIVRSILWDQMVKIISKPKPKRKHKRENPIPCLVITENCLIDVDLPAWLGNVPSSVIRYNCGGAYSWCSTPVTPKRCWIPPGLLWLWLLQHNDFYSEAKAQAEAVVLGSNGKNGLLTCAIRPSGIFGPGDKLAVPAAVAAAKAGKLKVQ